jgi:hypothetical protein
MKPRVAIAKPRHTRVMIAQQIHRPSFVQPVQNTPISSDNRRGIPTHHLQQIAVDYNISVFSLNIIQKPAKLPLAIP